MERLLALLLLCASSAQAATLTFVWNASAASEQVIAYRVYERVGTNYTLLGTTNTTSLVVPSVIPGQHFYSVTASNLWGESIKSIEVITPTIPLSPSNLTLQVTAVWQGSRQLNGPWDDIELLGQIPASPFYSFYRAKVAIR